MTITARRLGVETLEDRAVPAAVGILDPSFEADGVLRTTFGGNETVAGVALQVDGKIVVAGTTAGQFAIARYNPDGSLDTTFDGDGKVTVDFGFAANDETAAGLAIQADGMIVIAGTATVGGDQDFIVARLTTAGALDTTFSGDGKASFNFNSGAGTDNDVAFAVTTQVVGGAPKIVVVGSTDAGGAEGINFGVVRFNDNGTVDTSFNRTAGGTDTARAVAIDAANNIVVAGFTNGFGTNDFAVMRFTAAGTFDPGFDGNTNQIVDFGGDDQATGLALQPDGKIVVVGSTTSGNDFAVIRLNTNGSLDNTFSADGKQTVSFGGVDVGRGVAVQDNGRIVVVGFTDQGGGTPDNFAIARLSPDGSLDASFGVGGKAGVDFSGDDEAVGVVIDRNGRLVVAGRSSNNNDFAVARLIGTVEKGDVVAVGGTADGQAAVFAPNTAGQLPNAATAAVSAFGGAAVNVRTAVGDVDGDGVADIILVTGPGTPIRVAVVSGVDNATVLVAPFDPFGGDFLGGGFVAAGDFDHDGRAEFVVTPDQGGGPRVSIFSLPAGATTQTLRANFFGIDDAAFRGGARAAVGDVSGDGVADLAVAAGFLGGPRTALFNGTTLFSGTPARLIGDFFAFPGSDATTLRNGVFVAVGDVTGDGFADLIFGGGPGGAPRVFVLSGALVAANNVAGAQATPVANFFVAGNAADRGGVRVGASDLDGDNKADVAAGSGEGSPARVRVYLGVNVVTAGEPATFQDLTPFGGAVLPGGVFVG
ncbi:hypothetical protein J0H58_32385 [bacterium]|nr:hypothetical protein [bacterium]